MKRQHTMPRRLVLAAIFAAAGHVCLAEEHAIEPGKPRISINLSQRWGTTWARRRTIWLRWMRTMIPAHTLVLSAL